MCWVVDVPFDRDEVAVLAHQYVVHALQRVGGERGIAGVWIALAIVLARSQQAAADALAHFVIRLANALIDLGHAFADLLQHGVIGMIRILRPRCLRSCGGAMAAYICVFLSLLGRGVRVVVVLHPRRSDMDRL